jgi:curved DNA-binding protein
MRARSHPEVASLAEAYALLGLTGPAEGPALSAAFRTAVKTANPDQDGGDAERFRKVIAAWRLIQADAAATPLPSPAAMPPTPPVIALTPMQALAGATVTVRLAGRTLKVRTPKGLRSGDALRLRRAGPDGRDLTAPALIRAADGLSVLGDDLYMDWPIPHRLLEDGGRIEIETHAGPRSAWITAGQETLRLRFKDLGLPALGGRPQGSLFVTLKPADDAPTAAEDLLVRFTRVWTPERLAA